MLASYGLLGIFVYGEPHCRPRPAPPTQPPMWGCFFYKFLCFLWTGGGKNNPRWWSTPISWQPVGGSVSVVHYRRGRGLRITPLFFHHPETQVTKIGMRYLPRSLCCFYLKHYIFFVTFFVFIHSFDKISMLLLYFWTGVHHHFNASIIPSVFVCFHFLCFTHRRFFSMSKQKSSYFCIFISCGKPDCQLYVFLSHPPLKGFTLSLAWCLFSRQVIREVNGHSWMYASHHSSF